MVTLMLDTNRYAEFVIVPLVIDQLYVAPLCAGTLAFADVEAQTEGGAVIDADGGLLMRTEAVELLPQPAEEVTAIASVTLPEAPGVKMMALVPAPPVIVPLVIDQL